MTIDNLRTNINARIHTLGKKELEELREILNEKFPQKLTNIKERPIGLRKGSLRYMAADFDHPLEDIIRANQEEANDLLYQQELSEWNDSMLL